MECPDYGEFKSKDWPDPEKGFAQLVWFLDQEVGRVMDLLKKHGLAENTLVLFSSDNGPHQEGGHQSDFFNSNGDFKGIKRDLTDGGIRVPFLAWWPGKVKAGAISDHVSGFQDLLPTVADLSGSVLTTETDGLSLKPTLLGESGQKQHPHLCWYFGEKGGVNAALKWPWKLIQLNTGSDKKAKKKLKMTSELYNLEDDIGEETNLASKHPEKVKELEQLLTDSYREP
jgi:arylsulfatase A-like enzyme